MTKMVRIESGDLNQKKIIEVQTWEKGSGSSPDILVSVDIAEFPLVKALHNTNYLVIKERNNEKF